MPVRFVEHTAVLSGVVEVEAAEALHQHWLSYPGGALEWEAVEHVHAAVLQVLLAHCKPLPEGLFPVTVRD